MATSSAQDVRIPSLLTRPHSHKMYHLVCNTECYTPVVLGYYAPSGVNFGKAMTELFPLYDPYGLLADYQIQQTIIGHQSFQDGSTWQLN